MLVLIFSSSGYCGAVEILNVRHWSAPDHTRIVLDVDGKPDYQTQESENLLVLNVKKSSLHKTLPQNVFINKPGIKKISFFKTPGDNIQIKCFLDRHQRVDVFKLNKFQNKPDRIVVDVILKEAQKKPKTKEKRLKLKRRLSSLLIRATAATIPAPSARKEPMKKILSFPSAVKSETRSTNCPAIARF